MKHVKKTHHKLHLTISFVLFVFGVIATVLLIIMTFSVIAHIAGDSSHVPYARHTKENILGTIALVFVFCIILGTSLAVFVNKIALKPIRKVIDATHEIAHGNFNVQLDLQGIDELEALSGSFNKMASDLSGIETLRNDFINNFSHEFKTPIVSIRGFAKLLKNGNLSPDEQDEYLSIIISESERLADLSTNILRLSKYETTEIIGDCSLFRLDEQIRLAVTMTEPKWSGKEISLHVELEEITFNGNANLTQQIWLNLLDNAIKFTNQNGTIQISLLKQDVQIIFTICDDGIGMDHEMQSHIFDKFYQGDTSRSKKGNGLGLALIRQIVAMHEGSIEVISTPKQGSTFVVRLPC